MGIFGPPNIDKLKAAKNYKGLIGALEHRDKNVRKEAIAALSDIGEPAVEPLIGALKQKDYKKIRDGVAEALRKIGGDKAIETLIEALSSKEYFAARDVVINALGSMKDERVVKPLIGFLKYGGFSFERSYAAEALGKIGGERAVEALNEALLDKEAEVRYAQLKEH